MKFINDTAMNEFFQELEEKAKGEQKLLEQFRTFFCQYVRDHIKGYGRRNGICDHRRHSRNVAERFYGTDPSISLFRGKG